MPSGIALFGDICGQHCQLDKAIPDGIDWYVAFSDPPSRHPQRDCRDSGLCMVMPKGIFSGDAVPLLTAGRRGPAAGANLLIWEVFGRNLEEFFGGFAGSVYICKVERPFCG